MRQSVWWNPAFGLILPQESGSGWRARLMQIMGYRLGMLGDQGPGDGRGRSVQSLPMIFQTYSRWRMAKTSERATKALTDGCHLTSISHADISRGMCRLRRNTACR